LRGPEIKDQRLNTNDQDQRPTTPNQSPISPIAPNGIQLRLRVQPRASRTELAGIHGDALRVRLGAAPVDGAANQALIRLLADLLSVPRSAVQVIAGEMSRSKIVAVSGIGPEEAARRLGWKALAPSRRSISFLIVNN
jgi:uncharacterized protein